MLCLGSASVFAQDDASCIASAPKEVAVNQQFQYTVTTTVKGTVLETDFGKFDLVGGPSMGSSTSITISNGTTVQNTKYTYTYVLSAKREGTFKIPGVSISVDGKVLRSNSVEVQVVKASKQTPENQDNSSNFFQFDWSDFNPFGVDNSSNSDNVENADDIKKDDLFVKSEISQAEAWQGEAVVITHKLYIKQDIRGYEVVNANYPVTNALWLDHLDLTYSEESTETIKGVSYHVYTIMQTAAYPLKTGKVTIPKLDLTVRIGVPAVVNNPFWGRMTTVRAKDFRLTSNGLTLKVKALPNVGASDSTRIVGHFDIEASLNKSEVYKDEAVTLVVKISGNGNLHHIASQDLNVVFPSDCELASSKISKSISAKGNLVSGSKSFLFTLIPNSEGECVIPAVSFTYYDDETQSPKTISTEEFRIKVKPSRRAPQNNNNNDNTLPGKVYKI